MSNPQYLTAPKISLLILVRLYCTSRVPPPAIIPVLSFILSHSVLSASPDSSAARVPLSANRRDTSFPIRAFKDLLQSHASYTPGRTLLDVFLKHMWDMDSLDALFDLFDQLEDLLAERRDDAAEDEPWGPIYLFRASPLGALVRKSHVEFVRLQFDDAVKLWSAFISYRAPTALWTERLAELASFGVDIVAADMGLEPSDGLFEVAYGCLSEDTDGGCGLSVDDLERLLDVQLDRIQRLGCRVPDEMKDPLRDMIALSAAAPPRAHLVHLFDAWKAGDYTVALDTLHRYFDYAMQARGRNLYQYALLHMAILQADFGYFGESIAAINETIATAKENQDIHCLNFSLNWLHHMTKAYPKQMKRAGYMGVLGSEKEGLTFLKAKARETKAYNLLSATLLNEAMLCLTMGDPVPHALECLYQSSHLNLKEDIGSHGSHMLFHSALFARLGVTYLSGVYCELLLHCYHHDCPLDEYLKAIIRRAFLAQQRGRYVEALNVLNSIDASTHRSLKLHRYIFLCTGVIKLRRAIHRTDWTATDALLASLKPDSSPDPELSYLLTQTRIDCFVARGLYSEAFGAIEELSANLKEGDADVMQRVFVLIAKADLFSRIGKPEQGFSVALRAASVSFRARLMPCLCIALGLLANILNGLAEFDAGARILRAVIPQSLENGDLSVTGKLYSYLGDSYMGLASLDDTSTRQGARLRRAHVSDAVTYVDRAGECFKRIQDLEGESAQLMKKAIVARQQGNEPLSDEWAREHNRVWERGMARLVDKRDNDRGVGGR